MIYIKGSDLKKTLELRKAMIGGSSWSGAGSVIGGIGILYKAWGADSFQTFLGILLIAIGLWKLVQILMSCASIREWRSALRYDHHSLYKEIKGMDQTKHAHSIIAIMDSFNPCPGRFLVYDDARWGCRLFPNYPTQQNTEENEEYLKRKIAGDLKIPEENICLIYKKTVLQEKYSESHKENRVYLHRYYVAKITNFPKNELQNNFAIEGRSYHWMTIDAMLQDENIRKKNEDVIKEVNAL